MHELRHPRGRDGRDVPGGPRGCQKVLAQEDPRRTERLRRRLPYAHAVPRGELILRGRAHGPRHGRGEHRRANPLPHDAQATKGGAAQDGGGGASRDGTRGDREATREIRRGGDAQSRGAGRTAQGIQTGDGTDDPGAEHPPVEPTGGGGGVGRDQAAREHEVRVRLADGRRVGGTHGSARGVAVGGERGAGGVRSRDRDLVQGRYRGRRRGGGGGVRGGDGS